MIEIAVIMCTWKRIDNLKNTIKLLESQTYKSFNFYIWNNNSQIVEQINTIIKPYDWIKVNHSPDNIGGIGRFYYAKEICNIHPKVIFIDDDQIFKSTFIQDMNNEYEPNTIKSWFSWKFKSDNYWDRIRITDGSEVHYSGTGGMILDSNIFCCPDLFIKLPEQYKFVEDLYLSWFCSHIKGWKLKSTKNIWLRIVEDGKDQYFGLKSLKTEFLQYLIKRGWKIKYHK